MKLIDKIKKAILDDEELEEEEIVKKIDVEKTTSSMIKEDVVPFKEESVPPSEVKKPIIFEEDDFTTDDVVYEEPVVKEEKKKPLYGGYGLRDEKAKEKFKPSPILSPVYGFMDKEDFEKKEVPSKSLDSLFKEEKKSVSLDSVREKAYGIKEGTSLKDNDELEKGLFYEMEDKVPGVDKVTLGDAEEYYNDLGLEYNIDYKDSQKDTKMTRSKKNKELVSLVDEEIKGNKKTEKDDVLLVSDDDEAEEKNLYDLIDMMYDSKE
jgi:hypothetical protein